MEDFTVYFDESRSGGYHAMAGYLASSSTWADFNRGWSDVLRDLAPEVAEFKASDCRHGQGEYALLPRQRRDALTRGVVDLITDRSRFPTLLGIAFVTHLPLDPNEETTREYEEAAYLLSIEFVLNTSIRVCQTGLTIKPRSLTLVFDRQLGIEGRAREAIEQCGALLLEEARGLVVGPIRFEESRDTPGIQAADLLAYESYKELKNRHETPPRPPSKALERLVLNRSHIGYFIDQRFIRAHRDADVGDHVEISPLLLFTHTGRIINPEDGAHRNEHRGY